VGGWAKAFLWAGILLACAGVGAFVAYKFPPNLFPPGVQDPGGAPSESPGPSKPEVVRWRLTMSSRTTHTYRVGGSCTSDWRLRGRIRLMESGRVRGRGIARLLPGAECDFPSAQIQSRRVVVLIVGRRAAGELALRFREGGRLPVGSQDLGGFLETLVTLRFSIPDRAGAEVTRPKRIEDPEDEIYASVTRIRLLRSL
jgi:hypothetical protein